MKPVGPVRNIQIAELKGWKRHGNYWLNLNGIISSRGLFDWSTSRNDTWELFEELPIIEKIRLLTALLSFYWTLRDSEMGGKEKSDPDWADFITVAWITWKGNQ